MMLFMTKQVILPKISLILQKWKSAPKGIYRAFLHESLKEPYSASAIFDAFEIIDVAQWSEIWMFYYSLCSWNYV